MKLPARRVRRVAGVLVLGLAVGAVLLLVRDVQHVRHDLAGARDHAVSARAAIEGGDLATAAEALSLARDRLDEAAGRQSSVPWRIARRGPGIGPAFRAVDETSSAATAAVDVGQAAVHAAMAVESRGVAAGRLPLEVVRDLEMVLDGPRVRALVEAVAALREPVAGWVPDAVLSARQEMLEAAEQVVAALEPIRVAAPVLPGFLGADAPRQYLVAMQNNAELRGTGGLIGFHALMTVDDGDFDFTELDVDESLDLPAGSVALDGDFQERYGRLGVTDGLVNVNLDPDFPTTAPILMRMYEAATGRSLDGVIAVDPTAVATLLAGQAPLTVHPPDRDILEGVPLRVEPDQLPRVLLVDAYQALGGDTPERKAYHAAVGAAVFDRLGQLTMGLQTFERIADVVGRRHLQLYSVREDEQRVFDGLGATGRLEPEAGHDLLALTANNASGTKQDVHVRHRLSARILLDPEETTGAAGLSIDRRVNLRVRVDNPLPSEGRDPYILGTSSEDAHRPAGLAGTNRTWFTVWAPGSSRVSHGRAGEGPLRVSTSNYRRMLAIDHVLETPPRSRAGYEVAYAGPVQVRRQGDRLVYRLLLWRQAKAVADHVELEVTAADGWRIVDGEVTGSSDADLLGFDEPGVPLDLSVTGGGARVAGTATGDMHLVLELEEQTVETG